MPSNTLTIDADQRATLHRQVVQHLSGIGDVYVAYAQGEFADAERLGEGFAEDLQMLDGLGWAPVDPRDSFELRMPAEELTQTLTRLRSEVEGGLDQPEERRARTEAEEVADHYRRTKSVCTELLAALGQAPAAS